MEIEIETEAMAAAATIGRDSTTVMGMMILANEGISLPDYIWFVGWVPSISAFQHQHFLSPSVGVRHAISVSQCFDSSMGKPVILLDLRQPLALSVALPRTRGLSPFCNKFEGTKVSQLCPPHSSTQRCNVVRPEQGKWSVFLCFHYSSVPIAR